MWGRWPPPAPVQVVDCIAVTSWNAGGNENAADSFAITSGATALPMWRLRDQQPSGEKSQCLPRLTRQCLCTHLLGTCRNTQTLSIRIGPFHSFIIYSDILNCNLLYDTIKLLLIEIKLENLPVSILSSRNLFHPTTHLIFKTDTSGIVLPPSPTTTTLSLGPAPGSSSLEEVWTPLNWTIPNASPLFWGQGSLLGTVLARIKGAKQVGIHPTSVDTCFPQATCKQFPDKWLQ